MDKGKKLAIEKRLAQLTKQNAGRLTPDAVVADAKNPKSVLHSQFEWSDTVAAHQWRLAQARELIRTIRVEYVVNEKIISAVAYIRDPDAGEDQGYREVATLRDERDIARSALLNELRSALALMERAKSLAEVLGLSSEFESLQERTTQLHARVVSEVRVN